MRKTFLLFILAWLGLSPTSAQTSVDDDIWKELEVDEVNFARDRNYCQRLYGYYRYIDDGVMHMLNHEYKLYNVQEGIFEIDVRYSKDSDDGANVIVGRDLVHPEKPGDFMYFFELTPYTFLEKARKLPKHYRMEASGDTTRVYTKLGLAGTAIKDPMRKVLHIDYDALAPDTTLSLNLLLLRVRLSNVKAKADYWYDEVSENYTPQGNLKYISFDGKIDMKMMGSHEVFNEFTELYIDSVAYYTRDEYRADKKTPKKERLAKTGYTDADIDRLKAKLGVKPLSDAVLQRIEDQRDWDEEYELWKETNNKNKKNNTIKL